jgi:linoleate 10R-lipoxygenase
MAKITPIQGFSLGADLVHLAHRDPPIAPDGLYDWQAADDANTSTQGHSTVTNLVQRVEEFNKRGRNVDPDPKVVVCGLIACHACLVLIGCTGRIP